MKLTTEMLERLKKAKNEGELRALLKELKLELPEEKIKYLVSKLGSENVDPTVGIDVDWGCPKCYPGSIDNRNK